MVTGVAGADIIFVCGPAKVEQISPVAVGGNTAVLESCYSPERNRLMYRGNVHGAHDGDVVRSYRAAPCDVDRDGAMPGEWYLAHDAEELSACLDPGGVAADRVCI